MALTSLSIGLDEIVADETPMKAEPQLIERMHRFGQWEAILVRPVEGGRYEIVHGRKRVAAARELGWPSIRAIVETEGDAAEPRELKAILINARHKRYESLRQLDTTRHARRLIERGDFNQRELAGELGMSPGNLCTNLKVLECADVAAAVEEDELQWGSARAQAGLAPEERGRLLRELRLEKAVSGSYPPVREVERKVAALCSREPEPEPSPEWVPALLRALKTHGKRARFRVVSSRETESEVTLRVAKGDRGWVRELLASLGYEGFSPAPAE